MNDFELLKRTYPVSKYKRYCDGYIFIMKHSTEEERKSWGINDNNLKKYIEEGEKYIYQVAKEDKTFKTMYLSFKNHSIIRKHIINFDDY